LNLKTKVNGLVIWGRESLRRFLVWASKPRALQFVGCTTKLTEEG
jgi:hypothetical protein